MSGHKPWREIRRKIPNDPKRERRREEMSRAYDAVRAVVDLADSTGESGVSPAELARALDHPNAGDAALLDRLAGAAERLGGRVEVRLVFPDEPRDEEIALRVSATPPAE